MTFLAPMAGLVAAAVAVPVLLAFYLLKLRRRPLRVSSTLLWEQAVQDLQANAPLRWLRASWLLLLQALALAALLLAIARPALPGLGPRGSRLVLIIDASASMAATDGLPGDGGPGPATRLDQAKRDALRMVDEMRRGAGSGGRAPQAMVITLASEPRTLTGFTPDPRALREAIESVEQTDQPADLDAALRLVRALAAPTEEDRTGDSTPPVALYLFSDGGFAPDREEPIPPGAVATLVPAGPAAPQDAPAAPDNVGIVAISARRDYQDPVTARVFARLQNASAREVAVQIRCTAGGETVALRTVTIPGVAPGEDGRPAPGEAPVTFEVRRAEGATAVVSVARPDLLASDNTAAIVLSAVSKPRVLVVGPGAEGSPLPGVTPDPSGVDQYLLSVLEVMDLGALRTIDRAAYEAGVARAAPDGDPRRAWGAFDLIIFDRVRPASLPGGPSLSIGAGLPLAGLVVEPRPPGPGPPRAVRFASWRRTHPVLRYVALDPVVVSPPMRLVLPDAGAPGGAARAAAAIADGADGPLIALLEDADGGARRLVLAFELSRTNWGPDASFPIFLNNAVEYLAGRGDAAAGRSFTTDTAVTVEPNPGAAEVVAVGPREVRAAVPPRDPGADTTVSLGRLPLAGVYTVRGVRAEDSALTVNLVNAHESALPTAGNLGAASENRRPAGSERGTGDRPVREVWHWFLAAAAALLTIEWFVYAWRSRV